MKKEIMIEKIERIVKNGKKVSRLRICWLVPGTNDQYEDFDTVEISGWYMRAGDMARVYSQEHLDGRKISAFKIEE